MNEQLRRGSDTPVMTATLAPQPTVLAAASTVTVSNDPALVDRDGYFVQVGSFSDPTNAERTRMELAGAGPVEITPVSGINGELYRVRIGPLKSASRAERALEQAVSAGHLDARLVVAQGML
jgi:cell division protein FtsN